MNKDLYIIKLLPEHIANQIAAGEVVQRPSNIVKELLENSIDARATSIQLNLHQGGKSLIEIIDNGTGMSRLDARMAFERHATSKIKTIEDLYRIRTMGFRGEALASIAAVSKVEMTTRIAEESEGTLIELDNGKFIRQETVSRAVGTTITVKNLFFHVPARKHFLKSDTTELRYIITEFIRIVLAYPSVAFTLSHQENKLYQLPGSTLKQRIIQLFGKSYEEQLISVNEESEDFKITGFIGKPSLAKKTKSDGFLIVNQRYVRCPIIHKAIINAYGNMLASNNYPFYVLHISLDPKQIDINIHPSKQEIKFADERWIFTFIQSHIRYALAKNNIDTPLQFDLDKDIQSLSIIQTGQNKNPISESKIASAFNTPHKAHYIERDWKKEMDNLIPKIDVSLLAQKVEEVKHKQSKQIPLPLNQTQPFSCTQLLQRFLLVEQDMCVFLVDLLYAQECILYHQLLQNSGKKDLIIAQSLTEPIIVSLGAEDMIVVDEYREELKKMGFHLEQIGVTDIAIYAIPAHIEKQDINSLFDDYLEQIKLSHGIKEKEQLLTITLAKSYSRKRMRRFSQNELQQIVTQLFAIKNNEFSLDGHPIVKVLGQDHLIRWMRSL